MSNGVTIIIPYPDVVEARRLRINISELARNALRQKLQEIEKAEKESRETSAKTPPGNTSSESHPHQEESI